MISDVFLVTGKMSMDPFGGAVVQKLYFAGSPELRVVVPSLWHVHQPLADGCHPALKLWNWKGPEEYGWLPASYFPSLLEGHIHLSF